MYICRECETEINQATEICPHCGADLTGVAGEETAKRAKPKLGKVLMVWGALLAVLLGAMWSFLWFVVTPRNAQSKVQSESQALAAMSDLRATLSAYAAAQGGAYPQTLDPLGPAAQQAAQFAQSDGYQLQYTPGPPAADGAIRTYSIEARAGNYGYQNFYTDATGVVRGTGEDRAATNVDPPIH
jgi:type II secretory pathway pseudopilin PulG